ncbi:tRNA (adenine(58)-N(1))-methyltransferase non-catalytic subunit trm6 [Podila clonocystis]|nr:tRNA (adenine(58)-N(1))-methyltransferase non-catalytic subunit trm6 [Podila clonocystis]
MVNPSDIIQAGEHVLIKMPSDNVKCVVLNAGSTISLGKFGSFKANDIIGHAWGNSYEIYDRDNKTRVYHPDDMNEIDETANNNREIVDDGASQKLTSEQIKALKNEGLKGELTGEEIVNKLKESHATFDKKTAYSQAKYLQKKGKKFHKVFTPIKPTAYSLNEYFYIKNPAKIRDIRMDTLSQLLSYSNVHAGAKLLVVDDTQGMVVSALAERMGGKGTILGLYDGDSPHYDIVKYMNFDQETSNSIKTLSWGRIHRPVGEKTPDELQDVTQLTGKDLEGYHRRLKAYNIVEESRKILFEGDFDGLIIASQYQPESILEKLIQYVRGSRPVVVYHTYKEALLETSTWMRKCPDLLAPQITESWLRKSQVLPGRTHPEMSTWGTGGSLLTATKVIDFPVQAALTKRERLAIEKKNAEAKKLKRAREESEASGSEAVEATTTTVDTTTSTTTTTITEAESMEDDERSSKRAKQE